jgi:hypothetical protein
MERDLPTRVLTRCECGKRYFLPRFPSGMLTHRCRECLLRAVGIPRRDWAWAERVARRDRQLVIKRHVGGRDDE